MKNSIYYGTILHQRFKPVVHKFTYKVSYYFFDLMKSNEIKTIPFLLTFNPNKYLSEKKIYNVLIDKFGENSTRNVKRIFILTQLSYLGLSFNPVSFYYCYNQSNQLVYIISQITNTPWGEKHTDCFDFKKTNGQLNFPKEFHVSPFMPMEIDYQWKFSNPSEKLSILMTSHIKSKDEVFFYAQMDLLAKELNRKNVLINFISYPLISFKTIFGIYFQALILYIKKTPFYTHPKKERGL